MKCTDPGVRGYTGENPRMDRPNVACSDKATHIAPAVSSFPEMPLCSRHARHWNWLAKRQGRSDLAVSMTKERR